MTQSNSDALSAAALDTNRAGRLTDDQRKGFRSVSKAIRHNELFFGVMAAVVAALLFTSTGPTPNAWFRPVVSAVLVVVAVVLVLRGTVLGDSLTQDLRSGKVESIDGALGKRRMSARETTFYYFDVAGKSFEVGYGTYEAAPDAGYVRLYVLPRSHKVVNFERLPDRPLPEGALTSPTVALGAMATALLSPDRVRSAEARAELASMKDAMQPGKAAMRASMGPAAPPPASQRDPRPLAEAILGTWQTGPISMTFMPDGTVAATLGFRRQNGHWSIGPDGRLRSDAMGSDQTADAWVAGDTLSISENGQAMAFQRAPGN
ncbi:MAG: hypothetical protein ACHQ01_03790 [Candidatus Limnocylindrales bacterium]